MPAVQIPNNMDQLPSDVWHLVVGHLGNLSLASVAALSLVSQATRVPCVSALSRVRCNIAEWLAAAPWPIYPTPPHVADDDRAVTRFASDPAIQLLDIVSINGGRRKWVRVRAKQIGLLAWTHAHLPDGRATVTLTKPPMWCCDWHGAPAKKVNTPPSRMPSRLHTWREECDACGVMLDAWTAMYHYSGMGPFCNACIDEDNDLSGLEWEAKADFWDPNLSVL